MALKQNLLTVAAVVLSVTASPLLQLRSDDLETFIRREQDIALAGVVANVGGTNNSAVGDGPSPGVVVASPSTVNPDYFYTWTRDSALTMNMLIDEVIFGAKSTNGNSLESVLLDYRNASAYVQTVTNPSGTFYPAGQGLGEPKFYTNLTRYIGTWGRPQNDGPAFRASTFLEIIEYVYYNDKDGKQISKDVLWPLILNDLKYVGQYWNTTSYDPWEEVNGNSYLTTVAHVKALIQGSKWAKKLGETCAPCEQVPSILCFLRSNFWNATGGYISTDINANQVTRSMIGTDPLLGAIHGFDSKAGCDAQVWQPCNSYVLATHKVAVDSFRNLYPINRNASAPAAVLVGRYPEDTYYGGNPWYITTLVCAEVLYDAVAQIKRAGHFAVDNINVAFVKDIYPSAEAGKTYKGKELKSITRAMRSYADSFVSVVQQYTPANGTLNEQINATSGEPLSAIALTWSYASFITMAERRAGKFPPSWGAASPYGNCAAHTCAPSSTNSTFTYAPAVAAGAPSAPQTYSATSPPCLTEVLLAVNVSTMNGQNVYVTGNTSVLGGALNDKSSIVLPLHTGEIVAQSPTWYVDNFYPAGETIAYQYALQLGPGIDNYTIESQTRTFTAPACGGPRLYVPAGNITSEFIS